MSLFMKKSKLPKGRNLIGSHPSASKADIADAAASLGFIVPDMPDYGALQQRQLACANGYATFYKTGEGLFFHETAYAAEGHLASIDEALTRYSDAMESTYRAALQAEILKAQNRLTRIGGKPTTKNPRPQTIRPKNPEGSTLS